MSDFVHQYLSNNSQQRKELVMKIDPSMTPWFVFVVWIIGWPIAIFLIAFEHKKRLGGTWFSHIVEDIKESPLPALLGYFLHCVFGWISVLRLCIVYIFNSAQFLNLLIQRLLPKNILTRFPKKTSLTK